MVSNKSLDEYEVIAALLRDVQNVHGLVFNTRSCRLTLNKVKSRLRHEGWGFLTKTLPRLGKAFDKALAGNTPLNSTELGFDPMPGSQLPRFLGELFSRVLRPDGTLLCDPCAKSVESIRLILFVYYKYELPYTDEQEQSVIQKFEKTEDDLSTVQSRLNSIESCLEHLDTRSRRVKSLDPVVVAREARILLSRLFASFDPLDIYPRHGPGAVATKQQLWDKYLWTNVSDRITSVYPFDAYFCASMGHVCDTSDSFKRIGSESLPARVVLVPKDSRGPRLISCEPVDYQWIQQGLGRAIVELVERHPITKWNVNFTHQYPNRCGALLGSSTGRYATLDLNEASDRVSIELVRLLFPKHVYTYLEACRSLSTELPDGRVIKLKKFAPMGSSLCFPILALTTWAILAAGSPDQYTRERILVYGDDVIVPTAFAVNAIELLESFGLKVNRDKSCTNGLFRESCGMDAFQGKCVTPVRLRTVWSSTPSADSYTSWISYANSFWDRKCYRVYNYIVERLVAMYGPIPSEDMNLSCPSLRSSHDCEKKLRHRTNRHLQKRQFYVWDVTSPVINKTIDGWSMLLRYFTESVGRPVQSFTDNHKRTSFHFDEARAFSVGSYTKRRASMLVRRWR